MKLVDYKDYANRFNEFDAIENSFYNGNNVVFLVAGHAYGVTSFLKTFCERKKDAETDTFFLSLSQHKCLIELLLEEMIKTPYLNDLQKMLDKYYGVRNDSLLTSATRGIPYAGDFISNLISSKQAVPIYAGYFSSIFEELLIPFFNNIYNKRTVIFAIDHSQNINENNYPQLVNLLLQCKIKIIFTITDTNTNALKLENYISNFNTIRYEKLNFEPPQIKLVKELGNSFGYELSSKKAEVILKKTERNIHKIIANIKFINEEIKTNFNHKEKTIVSFLYICSFPISHSDMNLLLKKAGHYYQGKSEWQIDCLNLTSIGVIKRYG